MDKKVKFNIEKDIFGRIQNNVFRSKTICTAEGQGIRLIRIDFFYWIKQNVCKYGHFWAKMAQVHKIYSVETAHGTYHRTKCSTQ